MSDKRTPTLHIRRTRRKARSRVVGTAVRPRISVYRSSKHIYVQIIDDVAGKTLISVSSEQLEKTGTKSDMAVAVGKKCAELALQAGLMQVVFDRSGYRYHGRIKALAEAAREAGLKF